MTPLSNIENNAICVRNFEGFKPLKSKKQSLIFKDSLYKLADINLACVSEHTSIIALTFKVSEFPEKKQLLFGTKALERGLILFRNQIQILGSENHLKIPYIVDEYNTIIVVYKNTSTRESSYCFLNSEGQYFTTDICKTVPPPDGIYIGGRIEGETYNFIGEMVALDIYEGERLPSQEPMKLIEIVMDDHLKRVYFD